ALVRAFALSISTVLVLGPRPPVVPLDLLVSPHQLQEPSTVFHGFLPLAQAGVDAGAVVPGAVILGVHLNGLGEIGHGLDQLSELFLQVAPIVPGSVKLWAQLGAARISGERLLRPAGFV